MLMTQMSSSFSLVVIVLGCSLVCACFKAVIFLQGDDDDTPELGFNFSDDSRGFSEASQSQMSQPSLPGNDSGLNVTSLTGDKLLSQPYKVN